MTASQASPATAEYDGLIGRVLALMSDFGEAGVGLALVIETVFPPAPSEVILPVAGFLCYSGEMNFALVVLFATAGSMLGAYGYYFVGAAIGRERTRRLFAKLPLFEVRDFDLSERAFDRWGAVAVMAGRCLPVVRSVISIPAGIAGMPIGRFSLYTLIGSAVWNSAWAGLGFAFGPRIEPTLSRYSELLSTIVLAVIGALFLWFVVARTIKLIRRDPDQGAGPR
ncbi:DedA family protein [Glycomyces tarimensis]